MAAVPAKVLELRRHLEQRFPDAQPVRYVTAVGAATGLGALDAALPGGGFPRGRATLWRPGGGATAVLLSACEAAFAAGERAAWVDAVGEGGAVGVAGAWGGAGWREGLLFRPRRERAVFCVEELLRSGGVGLVVLTGVEEGLGEGEGVRLARAAREGGAALVVVGRSAPLSHLRIRSAYDVSGFRWRKDPFDEPVVLERVALRARLESMGLDRRVRFSMRVEHHDVRLSLEPWLADRRGVRR